MPHFVDKYYEMDPHYEAFLFDGTYLREGMIVLSGDSDNRMEVSESLSSMSPDRREKAMRFNRWFKILRMDIDGTHMAIMAQYEDGGLRKLIVPVHWPWIVIKSTKAQVPKPDPLTDPAFNTAVGVASPTPHFVDLDPTRPIDVPENLRRIPLPIRGDDTVVNTRAMGYPVNEDREVGKRLQGVPSKDLDESEVDQRW